MVSKGGRMVVGTSGKAGRNRKECELDLIETARKVKVD